MRNKWDILIAVTLAAGFAAGGLAFGWAKCGLPIFGIELEESCKLIIAVFGMGLLGSTVFLLHYWSDDKDDRQEAEEAERKAKEAGKKAEEAKEAEEVEKAERKAKEAERKAKEAGKYCPPDFADVLDYLLTIVAGGVTGLVLYYIVTTGVGLSAEKTNLDEPASMVVGFLGGLFQHYVLRRFKVLVVRLLGTTSSKKSITGLEERLTKLAALHDKRLISDEDFDRRKKEILDRI